MTIRNEDVKEGPFEGSRCLAGPFGAWAPATIRRIHEDGTFKVEFDQKDMILMPYWYGVLPSEVSFDDAAKWPAAFGALCQDGETFSRDDCQRAFALLGYDVTSEAMRPYWAERCSDLLAIDPEGAGEVRLNVEQSYELMRRIGLCAGQLADRSKAGARGERYHALYWNQTRMGGREPSDLLRAVTLDDTFAAIGLAGDDADPVRVEQLRTFKRDEQVPLPPALETLLSQRNVARAVLDSHPNSPELLAPSDDEWVLRRSVDASGVRGDFAVTIMLPHQGDFEWVALYSEGDQDARMCVRWESDDGQEVWNLAAPTSAMFFWDLAQTGLSWYEDTKHGGGKPVRRTDIGLALDRPAS